MQAVAVAMRATVRAADRSYRWGGDEFLVLMPDTPLSECHLACRRIEEGIRRSVATSAGQPIEVSTGAAALAPTDSPEALVSAADGPRVGPRGAATRVRGS